MSHSVIWYYKIKFKVLSYRMLHVPSKPFIDGTQNDDGYFELLFQIPVTPRSEPHKPKLVKSGVGQELAIDVLRMQWRNVSGDDPPKSVCSEPCPMGHVRSYAVSSLRHTEPPKNCFQ